MTIAETRERIAAARRRLTDAEIVLLHLRSRRADLRASRAAAAAGSEKADRLDAKLAELETDLVVAAETVAQEQQDLDAERRVMVKEYDGDPFSMLNTAHPLLLLPVRLETRFAWTDDDHTWTFGYATRPDSRRRLLIRVYPDDIHADSHEPWPTRQERSWQQRFRRKVEAGRDLDHFVAAWEELFAAAGYPRAAFLAHTSADAPAHRRPAAWSRAPRASLLPDQWQVQATLEYDNNRETVKEPFAHMVADPLEAAPDPAGWREDQAAALVGLVSPGMRWMIDFNRAVAAGMAHVMAMPGPGVKVRRLRVVGLRTQLDPAAAAEALSCHLGGAHYTHGLSMPAPGTPTTNTATARSPRRMPDAVEDMFRIDGDMRPLAEPSRLADAGPGLAGHDTARVLGVPTDTFDTIDGAWQPTARAARLIRTLLVDAFARPLRRAVGTALNDEDADALFEFFRDHVNALGHASTLRINQTPYGLLPVIAPGDPDSEADGTFEARLGALLDRMRDHWRQVAVPELGTRQRHRGQQTGVSLLQALATDAVTSWVGLRPALGPENAEEVTAAGDRERRQEYQRQREVVRNQLRTLGINLGADERLTGALVDRAEAQVIIPLVQPDPTVGEDGTVTFPEELDTPHGYLRLLTFTRTYPWEFGLAQLARDTDVDYAGPGRRPRRTLLFEICRLAILTAADEAARAIIVEQMNPSDELIAHWDAENPPEMSIEGPVAFIGANGTNRLEWPDLDTSAPIHQELLNDPARAGHLPDVLATIDNLHRMLRPADGPFRDEPRFTAHDLEVVLRAELGSLSYRLDAWVTALAGKRLARLRDQAETGLHLGGYGVVEHLEDRERHALVPDEEVPKDHVGVVYDDLENAGYVHAPSPGHATTAAILLSEHIASGQETFSVNLSSARVRRALHILDGIRHQQPLGALLGYRIEQSLKRSGHAAAIATVRRAAPIVADKLTSSNRQPAEAVAANNVVDGLLLLERVGLHTATAMTETTVRKAVPGLSPDQVSGVLAALVDAADVLDAVADLELAEGVHQIVNGNAARANAATGAVPGAGLVPEDVAVTRTSRTGINLLHRVALVTKPVSGTDLDEVTENIPAGWANTPRASASPAVEVLARRVLPSPSDIRLQVESTGPDGAQRTKVRTLADLNAAAQDRPDLAIGALDLVYARHHPESAEALAPGQPPMLAPLEQRIVEMFIHAGGLDDSTDFRVTPGRDPDPAILGLLETLEIAHTIHRMLGKARPLAPADLALPQTTSSHELRPDDTFAALDGAYATLTALRMRLNQLPAANDAGDLGWTQLDADAARRALFEADQFGIPAAVPAWPADPTAATASLGHLSAAEARKVVNTDLGVRVIAAATEIGRRLAAAALAPSDPAPDAAEGPDPDTHLLAGMCERAAALFGGGFAVTADLEPTSAVGHAIFTDATAPASAEPAAVRRMLARTARVRSNVAALDATLGCAELTRNTGPVTSVVYQYPPDPAAEWAAHAPTRGGRVSVVASLPFGTPEEGRLSGLWVDEWNETIPSYEETTAVGVHYDAPNNAAPNVALLVVPGRRYDDRDGEPWQPDSVWSAIDEALDLAHMRAVGAEDVPIRGQLTPPMWSWAANHAQPCLDVAALIDPPPAPQ